MVSRVLGFVRDLLIANFLGAGMIADAFFVAFKLPNLFRSLFAEGAFNVAFVPLFSEQPPSPPFPAVCVFLRTSVSGSALRAGSAFSLNRCVRLSPPCGL